MPACAHCRSQIAENSKFCSACGMPTAPANTMRNASDPTRVSGFAAQSAASNQTYSIHAQRAGHFHGGFGQMFGLDPRIAFLTIVVDTMLFGSEIATAGLSTVLSVPVGIGMGIITYKVQRHWYGDDRESAMIKGLVVGLLTAIPTSLPGFLTIPSGILGLAHMLRRKKPEAPMIIEGRVGS